jgi:hypothetical protein
MIGSRVGETGMTLRSIFVVSILLVAAAARAAAPLPPEGQVVDLAGVLDTPGALQLSSTLSTYVDATGLDLSIVTVADLRGEPLADYAGRTLQARSAANPLTAVLIWAPPQQLAIAVSAPYASYLGVDEIRQVLDEYAVPTLRDGRTADALLQTVFALMVAAAQPADRTAAPSGPIVMVTSATADRSSRTPEAQAPPRAAVALPARDSLADVAALRQRLPDAPVPALAMIWETAGLQASELSAWLRETTGQVNAHFSGEAEMHPDRLAFIIAGLVAVVVVLVTVFRVGVRRRNPGLALSIAGMAAAAACWLLAGYLELALLLVVAGPLLWALLRLLPVLFTRADQERLPATGVRPGMASPPRPPVRHAAPPPRLQAAAKPGPRTETQQGRQKAQPQPQPQPQSQQHKPPDFTAAIERAHRDGIRTPALDHLIAQKGKRPLAQRQKQRQYWLIALFVCFFVAFPLVFVLLIAWAASELNQVKPPQQKLPDFVRQLIAELRAVTQHQGTRA